MSFSDLPFLTFFPNTSFAADGHPVERDIDRLRLTYTSPDREDLLTSKASIQELRHILKIRDVLVQACVVLVCLYLSRFF